QTIDAPSPQIKFTLYNGSGTGGTPNGTAMALDLGKDIVMMDIASLGFKEGMPNTNEPGIGYFKNGARAFIMVHDSYNLAKINQFKFTTTSPHTIKGKVTSTNTMNLSMFVPNTERAILQEDISVNGTMNTKVIPALEAVSGGEYVEFSSQGESATVVIPGGISANKAAYIPVGISASDPGNAMTIPTFATKYQGDSYTGTLSFTVEATYS
ncbi:MAG: hypothetical protein ACRY3E_00585, partial [Candidatus Lariskella arthropodorum]